MNIFKFHLEDYLADRFWYQSAVQFSVDLCYHHFLEKPPPLRLLALF